VIGIVLIAHDPLASALAKAARHVFGDVPNMEALDIQPEMTPGGMRTESRALIASVNSGDGVLVLTDLFGATPSNIAATLANQDVKVLAGTNLPMLLRAISYRAESLSTVAEKASSGGTLGILNVGSQAPQNQTMVPDETREAVRHFYQQQQQQQ
jgi:PTS system ascorbate-specific IIA component